MLKKHTTDRWHELQSQQGISPTVVPGAGATQIQFLLNSLPTQKDSKFWYYLKNAWLKLKVSVLLPTNSVFLGIPPEGLWQVLQSLEVTCPILGSLFAQQNTRGAVLGNVIQRLGFGYNSTPSQNLTGAGGGNTFDFELYYRLPFAQDFLANPMDTAPWVGFLEGGYINVNVAPTTAIATAMTGATITSVTARLALCLQPENEARIHTPVHYREHLTPATSSRVTITDMGSPDGLQGIDQSLGVGIAALLMLTGPDTVGFAAGTTANNITDFNIPWRDQPQIYNPELPYLSLIDSMGTARRQTGGAIAAVSDMGWPYLIGSAVPTGVAAATQFNNANALVFPLIAPGKDQYTSKLQTVAGSKDINFGFTATPTLQQRLVGCYFPVFDEQFTKSLIGRIAPLAKGEVEAKLVNKQDPKRTIRRVGKAAYTPDKIVG